MIAWCDYNFPGQPDDSAIRERLSKIFERLKKKVVLSGIKRFLRDSYGLVLILASHP
jgi:hypothetical protein